MSFKKKILWYYNRLSSMSAEEVFFRLREAIKRRCDHFSYSYWQRDYGSLPEIPSIKQKLTDWQIPTALIANWQKAADDVNNNRYSFLGTTWPGCNNGSKWHLDPATGSFWPRNKFCFTINYRHIETKGDIKYVWELNRLQYLQPLAALAFKNNDDSVATIVLNEIENWIDHNPPHKGVNWSSGIELGLRSVSILIICSLIGNKANERQRKKIWTTLREHGFWLARYPSRFSSANNHITAEGLGLFFIGSLCPRVKEARLWKSTGWAKLQHTADKQILDDGVGVEQTPQYSAVVLEMLLTAYFLANATLHTIPESFTEKLLQGAYYLRWFTDANGNAPRIGDDDNACIIGECSNDGYYINSVLGCISAMFNRADLVPAKVIPHFRNCLFGAQDMPYLPMEGLHSFEQGGYTVGHHRVNGREVFLAVDHGYLGYLSIAAHGHADALSVWLHLDGQPVLVDSGTYLYHSGGKWRDYFRSTKAHNTLTIEGENSSIISGHFNWSHKANASRTLLEQGPAHWQIDCVQDGYFKRFGTLHRRRVSVTPDRGFTVEDSITGDTPRNVEINFLLHPALEAAIHNNEIHVTREKKVIVKIMHLSPLTATIHAKTSDDCGWYSSSFGVKQPATRIGFAGALKPAAKAVTDFTFVWAE
jgi:uncharacterized heparinase superfamily protein